LVDKESNLKGKALEQENQQNSTTTHISWNDFVRDNKLMAYLIIGLIFSFLLVLVYLVVNEQFSERSKAQAKTSVLASEAINKTLESLESVPEIVNGFSSMIDKQLEASFLKKAKEVDEQIEKKFLLLKEEIEEVETKLEVAQQNLQSLLNKNHEINHDINKSLTEYKQKEKTLNILFPDIKKYKNIANVELLYRELKQSTWNEGIVIVSKMEAMIEDSKDNPIEVPSKYIEVFGDWCRDQNQFGLAKTFYMEAVRRDADNISAQVELYSLLIEYDANLRKDSVGKLRGLILDGKLSNSQVKRYLNALIKRDAYEQMYDLMNKMIESSKYNNQPIYLATLYKNRARAIEGMEGYQTEEAVKDIEQSYTLAPEDENTLYGYVRLLVDKKAVMRLKLVDGYSD